MKVPRASRRSRLPVAEAEGASYLVFDVGGEECALPLLGVREVVRIDAQAPPPQAPPALRGLMSFRGERIPIVDLAVAFGGPGGAHTPGSCALITSASPGDSTSSVGLAIDAVSRVVNVAPLQLAPARLGTLTGSELVAALASVGERFVPILDLDRVLALDEVRAAIGAGRASAAAGDRAPARTGKE